MNIKLLNHIDSSKLRMYYNTLFIRVIVSLCTAVPLLKKIGKELLSDFFEERGGCTQAKWSLNAPLSCLYLRSQHQANKVLSNSFLFCRHRQPKHRVQQEYNCLLVNALNRIFKSNLSLNNFKWLLIKLELSCVRNIIPRSGKRLWNGYPVLNKELQNHNPVGRHIPV